MKILGPKNHYKKINGFWKFAFLPVVLTNGDCVLWDSYFIGGLKHGISNRYDCGKKNYEVKYSKESARL